MFYILQRLGCVHSEDLMYVFGVPLYFHVVPSPGGGGAGNNNMGLSGGSSSGSGDQHGDIGEDSVFPKLGFFNGNFTRNEVQLSHTVMLLWSNFIRTG